MNGITAALEAFFSGARAGMQADVVRVLPDGAIVAIDLGNEGGTWTLSRVGEEMQVRRGVERGADCRITCTPDDFLGLLRGEIDGQRGFLDGRLKVEGDVGLVLKLHRVIRTPKAG